jgi:SNF2 family DNA or RNA helicase
VVTKLHSLLKPFMLRRMKADVEICLPRKQEILLYAPMSEEQQKINKQLLDRTLQVRGGVKAVSEGLIHSHASVAQCGAV